jgi:hypothetical protein
VERRASVGTLTESRGWGEKVTLPILDMIVCFWWKVGEKVQDEGV